MRTEICNIRFAMLNVHKYIQRHTHIAHIYLMYTTCIQTENALHRPLVLVTVPVSFCNEDGETVSSSHNKKIVKTTSQVLWT